MQIFSTEEFDFCGLIECVLFATGACLRESIVAPGEKSTILEDYHHIVHALIDLRDWFLDDFDQSRHITIAFLKAQSAWAEREELTSFISDETHAKASWYCLVWATFNLWELIARSRWVTSTQLTIFIVARREDISLVVHG